MPVGIRIAERPTGPGRGTFRSGPRGRVLQAALILVLGSGWTLPDPQPALLWGQQQDGAIEVREAAPPAEAAARSGDRQPGPQEVRMHLLDGTVIIGDLEIASLHMATQFGLLEVPVGNIVRLRPGLNSLPSVRQRLEGLVEQLGDRDFKVREQAAGELVNWGPPVLDYLSRTGDGGSAERKKHLQNILEQIAEAQVEEGETGGDRAPVSLMAEDSLTTSGFTIVGQVEEQEFRVSTRYGVLRVGLADIRELDRVWNNPDVIVIRRTVEIGAMAFFQTKPEATGLRVRRGDRVQIRASGSVRWENWGNMVSGPDGIPNHGKWQSFPCGHLVARVGRSGDLNGIGSKGEFTARNDGELFLGIAVLDDFATQEGFQWTGSYKARVVITPAPGGNP